MSNFSFVFLRPLVQVGAFRRLKMPIRNVPFSISLIVLHMPFMFMESVLCSLAKNAGMRKLFENLMEVLATGRSDSEKGEVENVGCRSMTKPFDLQPKTEQTRKMRGLVGFEPRTNLANNGPK